MNYRIPLLIALSLLTLVGMSYAGGCGSTPAGYSFTGCYPVNIVNTQASATVNGFQEQFNGLPFNALIGNWIFYNGVSGSTLPAWAESNIMVWANLEVNTIGATSSANGIYYFGLIASGTNLFIPGNNVGEAPEQSPNYCNYDNGNAVFPILYQAFCGTGTPYGWTLTSSGQVTIANSVTVTSGASAASILTTGTYNPNAMIIMDMLGNWNTNYGHAGYGGWGYDTAGYAQRFDYEQRSDTSYFPETQAEIDGNNGGDNYYTPATTTNGIYLYSYYWNTGGQGTAGVNYASPTVITTTPTGSEQIGIAWVPTGSGTTIQQLYWVRIRVYPPAGVMPKAIYGSLQTPTGAPTVTISPSVIQIDIGQSEKWSAAITGGAASFTYNWQVWNSLSGVVANALYLGLGATNSFAYKPNAIGTYYANVEVIDSHPFTANSLTATLTVVSVNTLLCLGGVPSNVISNVIFQNYNTSTLTIYTDSANDVTAYYSNTANVHEVINQTAYGLPYNASTTLSFLPKYIGQYNYSPNTIFNCQWSAAAGSTGGGGFISLPNASIPKYAIPALAMFVLGIILFLIALLNVFGVVNISGATIVGGILNFALAFGAILLLAFGGTYQATVNVPAYTVNTPTGIMTVNAISATSVQLVSNPIISAVIILVSIICLILGVFGLYFFGFDMLKARKEKREKKANQ